MWFISLILAFSIIWFISIRFKRAKLTPLSDKIILITGCDSGLGHFSAIDSYNKGFTVVATVLNKYSKGSEILKEHSQQDPVRMNLAMMDFNETHFMDDVIYVLKYLLKQKSLHAVINNAGIMCFGEHEWLLKEMIDQQIQINMIGPMSIVNELLPVIRQYKARIINVTSHCSIKALPGLSVYSASKAGLSAWTNALRKEMHKFDVKVINFIPGSFVMLSNVTAQTMNWASKMKLALNMEQWSVYGDYFERYYKYLSLFSYERSPKDVQFDSRITDKLMDAILDVHPKACYKVEPWRYTFYYTLLSMCPEGCFLDNWLTEKFMIMPKYNK